MLRTHTCGQLTKEDVGKEVTLTGWVNRRRDHGGVIFIDLRDKYGLTQITFNPEQSGSVHVSADKLRSEWVIKVVGEVIARPDDMVNKKLDTGEVEIIASELVVLNESETPPFEITDDEKSAEAGEHIRLKYRYLDLRRDKIQKLLADKDLFIRDMRTFFHKKYLVLEFSFLKYHQSVISNHQLPSTGSTCFA